MNDSPTIESELTRRLGDLAETTSLDPGALDRIGARTAGAERGGPGGPTRWTSGTRLLAAAAAVLVLATGVTTAAMALTGDGDGPDDVRTSGEGTSTTAPDTTTTSERPTTTTSGPPDAGPPAPGTTPDDAGDQPAPDQGQSATGSDPCPGDRAHRCVATDTGDVDGDGRADQVGLYIEPSGDTSAPIPVTVRVVYAAGGTDEHRVEGPEWGAALLGVTDLDGDGREEVAFLHDGGAHSAIGSFVGTAGTGSLHPVGFEGRVLYDGSAAGHAGFSCPDVDGDGRRELVVEGAYDNDDGTVRVLAETYRWAGDRLELVDTADEARPPAGDADGNGTDDLRDAVYGPRCGDLRAG
jgi:hypothetical protein